MNPVLILVTFLRLKVGTDNSVNSVGPRSSGNTMGELPSQISVLSKLSFPFTDAVPKINRIIAVNLSFKPWFYP
jgi:hypothetical protein